MNTVRDPIVFAVQSAYVELTELVEAVAQSEGGGKQEVFKEELEKTILMFIAAIVLADGEYRLGEVDFLSILVDWRSKPGGEARFLNEYAVKWMEASRNIPIFFHTAVLHDLVYKTNFARPMLCQIQLIGNNVSASDGRIGTAEKETVRRYVAFLEDWMNITTTQFPC